MILNVFTFFFLSEIVWFKIQRCTVSRQLWQEILLKADDSPQEDDALSSWTYFSIYQSEFQSQIRGLWICPMKSMDTGCKSCPHFQNELTLMHKSCKKTNRMLSVTNAKSFHYKVITCIARNLFNAIKELTPPSVRIASKLFYFWCIQ